MPTIGQEAILNAREDIADKFFTNPMKGKSQFKAKELADYFVKAFPLRYLITPMNDLGGDIIYRYVDEKGVYDSNGVPWIEVQLNDILGIRSRTARINEVIKLIRIRTYTESEDFIENPYMVIMNNGAFNILTGELEGFSSLHGAKCRIPVTYNPDAACPNFNKFLKRLFDNEEQRTFFQEWLGYHLLKDHRFQRTVILQGEGDNGKSTLLNVMTAFIGSENTSTQSLYRLTTNRFSIAELNGKMANIAADIGPEELKYTGIIKMLTGNDYITAERKNHDPFSFKNYAKLTFSCNQLPKTPDTTLAFYKRFIVLVTGKPIPQDKQDPELIYNLTTDEELSGIFNWAYEGLKRALENSKLTEPTDIQSRKELYQNMSDPETGFLNQYIASNPDEYIERQNLYLNYRKYCDENGFIPTSDKSLFKTVRGTYYVTEPQKTINNIKGVRVFQGIEYVFLEKSQENDENDTHDTYLTDFPTSATFTNHEEKNEQEEKHVKSVKPVYEEAS